MMRVMAVTTSSSFGLGGGGSAEAGQIAKIVEFAFNGDTGSSKVAVNMKKK